MFVAIVPPALVVEDLDAFLEPRRDAGDGLRWTPADQWHLTLAFMGDVGERRIEELVERLGRAAARRRVISLRLEGAGAFPSPAAARVLFADVLTEQGEDLDLLAAGTRAAANKSGAPADGGRFRAHLTLARSRPPVEATRWLRVLDAYRGPNWVADEVALIESHLAEGPGHRPRHEVVETFALGR